MTTPQKDTRYESFFAPLGMDQPFLKVGLEGFAGSGKTYTAALIAVGLQKFIKSEKPIVLFDTEQSSKFLTPAFKNAKIKAIVKKSRTLPDLQKTMQYCQEGNADILIIDSITHVWENFLKDYQVRLGRKKGFQFQDWAFIKPTWKENFSDPLVNGRMHVLFTGRAGYTYDYEEIDGRRELIKTGVKMKVEGETAYEPDILIMMERFERVLTGRKKKEIWREATILKDRANIIDGKQFRNPNFTHFLPCVKFLLDKVVEPTETVSTENKELFDLGEDDGRERRERKCQLERNINLVDRIAPGTSGAAKALKLSLLIAAYTGETSETAIGLMSLDTLVVAYEILKAYEDKITKIEKLERHVFVTDKLSAAERAIRFGTTNLGEVRISSNPEDSEEEHLEKYLDFLIVKYRLAAKEANGDGKKAEEPAKPAKKAKLLSDIGKKTESPATAAVES